MCEYNLRNDKQIVREACMQSHTAINSASPRLQNDEKFIAELKKDGLQEKLDVEKIDFRYKDQAMRAIKVDAEHWQKLGGFLQLDNDLAIAALHQLGYANPMGMDENHPLRNDKEFMLRVSDEKLDRVFQLMSPELFEDKSLVLTLMKDPKQFHTMNATIVVSCLPRRLQDDREIVKSLLSTDGYALAVCKDEIRDDKEMVLIAVTRNKSAISNASDEIRKLVGDGDPVEVITKAINAEKLHAKLNNSCLTKAEPQKPRMKI